MKKMPSTQVATIDIEKEEVLENERVLLALLRVYQEPQSSTQELAFVPVQQSDPGPVCICFS